MNGRRVHEVKVHDVVDTHRFQRQHHVSKIRPLDFRNGGRQHLVFKRVFSVKTVAFARPSAASATFALVCKMRCSEERQRRLGRETTRQIRLNENRLMRARADLHWLG
jgi:hypothetical protein